MWGARCGTCLALVCRRHQPPNVVSAETPPRCMQLRHYSASPSTEYNIGKSNPTPLKKQDYSEGKITRATKIIGNTNLNWTWRQRAPRYILSVIAHTLLHQLPSMLEVNCQTIDRFGMSQATTIGSSSPYHGPQTGQFDCKLRAW